MFQGAAIGAAEGGRLSEIDVRDSDRERPCRDDKRRHANQKEAEEAKNHREDGADIRRIGLEGIIAKGKQPGVEQGIDEHLSRNMDDSDNQRQREKVALIEIEGFIEDASERLRQECIYDR